jgi:hypothetical protein
MLSSLAFQPMTTADELPPRPPTATPNPSTRIILSLEKGSHHSSDWWTVIQWQDDIGGWHDVAGWQGTFDANRQVVWWLGPEHFGTGPFRWVIYESADRQQELAITKSFSLPESRFTSLEVKVSLP